MSVWNQAEWSIQWHHQDSVYGYRRYHVQSFDCITQQRLNVYLMSILLLPYPKYSLVSIPVILYSFPRFSIVVPILSVWISLENEIRWSLKPNSRRCYNLKIIFCLGIDCESLLQRKDRERRLLLRLLLRLIALIFFISEDEKQKSICFFSFVSALLLQNTSTTRCIKWSWYKSSVFVSPTGWWWRRSRYFLRSKEEMFRLIIKLWSCWRDMNPILFHVLVSNSQRKSWVCDALLMANILLCKVHKLLRNT